MTQHLTKTSLRTRCHVNCFTRISWHIWSTGFKLRAPHLKNFVCVSRFASRLGPCSLGMFCHTHFLVTFATKPCVWWQKRWVLKTMREVGRNVRPRPGHTDQFILGGLTPLHPPPPCEEKKKSQKQNACRSETPGDVLCEPLIISPSHVCLPACWRPSDGAGVGLLRLFQERWITPTRLRSSSVRRNCI